MKALEENVEQSLFREEQALADADGHMPDDVGVLQQMLRDAKVKHEVCKGFCAGQCTETNRGIEYRRNWINSAGITRRVR